MIIHIGKVNGTKKLESQHFNENRYANGNEELFILTVITYSV